MADTSRGNYRSNASVGGGSTASAGSTHIKDEAHSTAEVTLRAVNALRGALDDVRATEDEVGGKAPHCPIVYGSISFWLGNTKAGSASEHTHRWSLYVRGADGRDISYCIDKVVFTLHPTIPNNVREVTTHPFEVTETGWGEFEAMISVHFKDFTPPKLLGKKEFRPPPIHFAHTLKLYQGSQTPTSSAVGKPVVSEFYDELVFNQISDWAGVDPLDAKTRGFELTSGARGTDENDAEDQTSAGLAALLTGPTKFPGHPHMHHMREWSAAGDLATLGMAHAFVEGEMARLHERLARADTELAQLGEDLEVLGWPTGSV